MIVVALAAATFGTVQVSTASRMGPPPQALSDLPSEDSPAVVFPVHWVEAITAALTDFKKTHKNYACYRVRPAQRLNLIEVNFWSPLVVIDGPSPHTIVVTQKPQCGHSVTYLMRPNGKIVRKCRGNACGK